MRILIAAVLLIVSRQASAETTTLELPDQATLSFDAPKMSKLKEVSDGGRYEYQASSRGEADERFNLSVYVQPIDCPQGKSLKEVARCFFDGLKTIPGVVLESDSPSCSRRRCDILYITTVKLGDKTINQLHHNALYVYRGAWVDAHLSAVNPHREDAEIFARFEASLKLAE
jgi:hypothetical protein